MRDYYDRAGNPITMREWVDLRRNDRDYFLIALSNVGTQCCVSTVWLGLDHRFGDDGPPMIFETLVQGGPFDQDITRYATEREAREGHDRIVQHCRRIQQCVDGVESDVLEPLRDIAQSIDPEHVEDVMRYLFEEGMKS